MVKKEVSRDSYTGIKFEEDLSNYKLFDRELDELSHFVPRPPEPEEQKPERKEKVIRVPMLAGTAFLEKDEIEPLRRASPKIMGSLFDRVEFLRQRIADVEDSIRVREDMHKVMMAEIDADIAEKQRIEVSLVDMEEKRNFKLDISLLRREKRHESVQFWRDMVELKTELGELREQLETEDKIVGIFKDLQEGSEKEAADVTKEAANVGKEADVEEGRA